MNLDLKKFKKVDADDKLTILEHPNGHQIKISHKGLSEKFRKELDELPIHQAKGGFAKYAQKYDPNIKGNKSGKQPVLPGHKRSEAGKIIPASKPSKPSVGQAPTMPTSKEASQNYTEPQDQGTGRDAIIGALHFEAPPFGPLGTAPKQHYPPCINPSCKSFGRPHPNCRCYGGKFHASGGEVEKEKHFCGFGQRVHEPECEYYDDGGEVNDDTTTIDPDKAKSVEEGFKGALGFANGGDADMSVNFDPNQPLNIAPNTKYQDPALQAQINQAYSEQNPTPEQTLENLAGQTPQQQAPEATDQQAPSEPAPASDDESAADMPQPDVAQSPMQQPATPQQQFQSAKQLTADQIMGEANKYQNDLWAGHIQPETYQNLFDKKSTLGKIGTLFGLLVGGMGSGLTHQPNAILEMMNQEIQRDLQAQEQSARNKQNFLSINNHNFMTAAQANQMNVDTKLKSFALGNMQANMTAFHHLAQLANDPTLPPAQKARAQQALAMVGDAMNGENARISDIAASRIAAWNMLGQGGGGNNQALTAMQSGIAGQGMKNLGTTYSQNYIPGFGLANRPVQDSDRNQIVAMNTLDAKSQDLLNFINQHEGNLNPQLRAQAAQKAAELVNFYSNSLNAGVLTEGKLGWLDSQIGKQPLSILGNLMGNKAKLNEVMQSNRLRRGLLLGKYGLGQTTPQETSNNMVFSKSGRPMVQKNGKWVYQQ